MTDISDSINFGIGTALTLGVAGMAMKGMRGLSSPNRRRKRIKRRRYL